MKETGGPAFPAPDYVSVGPDGVHQHAPSDGMTLRDWFAGMALTNPNCGGAEEAYWRADQMLKERKA